MYFSDLENDFEKKTADNNQSMQNYLVGNELSEWKTVLICCLVCFPLVVGVLCLSLFLLCITLCPF